MNGRDRALQNIFLITGITGLAGSGAGFLCSLFGVETTVPRWGWLYAAFVAFAAEMWRLKRKGQTGLLAVALTLTVVMRLNYTAGYVGEWFYWTAGISLGGCLLAFFVSLSRLKDVFTYAPGGPFTVR